MQGNRPAGVLLVLAALLLVASAAPATAAAAAYSGRVDVTTYAAAGARASAHLDTALGTQVKRLEDEVAPELSRAASLLGGVGGSIRYGPLHGDKPACLGPCPALGNSYTGRGCNKKYGCAPM